MTDPKQPTPEKMSNETSPIPQEFLDWASGEAVTIASEAYRRFDAAILMAKAAYSHLFPRLSSLEKGPVWVYDRLPPDDTKRYAAKVLSMFTDQEILCVIKRSANGWLAGPIAGEYPSVSSNKIICWLDESPAPLSSGSGDGWNREAARRIAKDAYKTFAGLPSEFDAWFDETYPPLPQPPANPGGTNDVTNK